MNDPIRSYSNAQSHIGIPMSNFNEPWAGGELRDPNFDAAPYRTPVFGEPLESPPTPKIASIKISDIQYPEHAGSTHPQQLPSSRVHYGERLPVMGRQNLGGEGVAYNMYHTGDNRMGMPPTPISVEPNTVHFQGSTTAVGVHQNNDTANQETTANMGRTDFRGGQTPFQKLPNGITIGVMQPQDPGLAYSMAPAPDPQVLPGEGTAPLRSTNPAWW